MHRMLIEYQTDVGLVEDYVSLLYEHDLTDGRETGE